MNLSFVGAGGLAGNLAPAFSQNPRHRVVQIRSRSMEGARQLAFLAASAQPGDMTAPLHPDTEAVVLALPDSQIAPVAEALIPLLQPHQLLLHCAGSVPLSVLQAHSGPIGVLYPIQTFSRKRKVNWADIPMMVEGANGGEELVTELARSITGGPIRVLTSEQRRVVHLGAVLASNFTNALIAQATRLVKDLDLDHNLFLPLAREVVAKLDQLTPLQAQTGPAMRGDKETVTEQKALVREVAPELIPMYELMTQIINRMREQLEAQQQS